MENEWTRELDRLKAENERLREAVQNRRLILLNLWRLDQFPSTTDIPKPVEFPNYSVPHWRGGPHTMNDEVCIAHADFVGHDVHCPICSVTSRYGADWEKHLCLEGLALWRKSQVALRAQEEEFERSE